MTLSRLEARMLLDECQGDEIWPVELCRQKGIPETWILELQECFESGFRRDCDTIYYEGQMTNQFHGIRDRDLAFRLAEFLGVDTARATVLALSAQAEVTALRESVDE